MKNLSILMRNREKKLKDLGKKKSSRVACNMADCKKLIWKIDSIWDVAESVHLTTGQKLR